MISKVIYFLYRINYKLIYIQFLSIFILDYLNIKLHIIPRQATWISDVITLIITFNLVLGYALKKGIEIEKKYMVILLSLVGILFINVTINQPDLKAVLTGLRFYFKVFPYFVFAAIFTIDENKLKDIIKFLLALAIVQLPIVVYQRFVTYGGSLSGDEIAGTLVVSSILSMFLIAAISIAFAYYLNKKIKLKGLLLLLVILFMPTTLNATKGTLILAPLAFVIPVWFFPEKKEFKLRRISSVLLIVIGIFIIYIPVNDYFFKARSGSIVDFFSDKQKLESYLYRGENADPDKFIGRADAIVYAYKKLSTDFFGFLFGQGLGKISRSYFIKKDQEATEILSYGAQSLAITNILWELGFAGLCLYGLSIYLIMKDAIILSKAGNYFSIFSLGWIAICLILGISMAYKNIVQFDVISILFWFFSGIIAVKAREYRHSIREERKV